MTFLVPDDGSDLARAALFRADEYAEALDEEVAVVSEVFRGSENAGRIVVPVASVAGSVAADVSYDVHVVRHRLPPKAESLHSEFDYYEVG